jgi:hypothetical protein
MARYDRLQRSKVRQELGDPAGSGFGGTPDKWGKVSIPSLRERCPDIFCGWMNYGDLVWSFGYCSTYYEWPYTMLQQYLRLGDREFLDNAEDMVRARYDIGQYHVENTVSYLGGFQRAERNEHGHLERQEAIKGRNTQWEANCVPSHTWNRCLLLHWALTGDPRSLETAMENGRAYRRFFYDQSKLGQKQKLPYNEFRTPAWAMENWLALYEYTGEKKYLDWSNEVFDKTLLAMEKDNGSRGHIIKDGKQSAQFVGYMVEPVCRLHHHTGRKDVIQFLQRVLDWQREACTIRGVEKDAVYYPLLWREDWDFDPDLEKDVKLGAGKAYDFPLSDGYAYLYHVLGRKRDLEFAERLFKEALFYLTIGKVTDKNQRSPLGYHHLGTPFESTAKMHAWTGRYCQLYLYVEEMAK